MAETLAAYDGPFQTDEYGSFQTHDGSLYQMGNGLSNTGNSLFHLELIKKRDLSDQQAAILNIFGYGVQSSTPETAAEAACWLDSLCPSLEQQEEIIRWLWSVWDVMLDVAQSPDATGEIQERLISILGALHQCAKGEVDVYGNNTRVWKDLPMLLECLDPCFDDPTIEADGEVEFTPESVQIWLNMSTFAARIMGAGLAGGAYFEAMRVMRSALEEEPCLTPGIADCRVQAACAWIAHAARPLMWWAQYNIGYLYVPIEDEASYIEGGSLYCGPSTMCLQRWGFWIERFEELGKKRSGMSAETRKAALEAAETMRMVELRVGRKLSE